VENVSWNDVQEFIRKLNQQTGKRYRLPTEAEWEYAARGGSAGSATKYAGSNTVGDVAWYNGNSGRKTQPVGQKRPNELGLYDMSGNVVGVVRRLVWNVQQRQPDQPAGAIIGLLTAWIRGGSWLNFAQYCRVALPQQGRTGGTGTTFWVSALSSVQTDIRPCYKEK
jgi:formylglycine-generating enzyme